MALFKVILLLGSLLAVDAGIIFPDEKLETKNTEIVTEINEIVTETNEMVTENNEMVTENHEMVTEINQILFGTDQNQETDSQSSEFRSQLPNNETDISSNLIVFEPTCGDGGDYCEDPPAYPERDILKKIQNQSKLIKSMFEK